MTRNDHYERRPPQVTFLCHYSGLTGRTNIHFLSYRGDWWPGSSGGIHPPVRYYHYFSCSQRQVSPRSALTRYCCMLSRSILDSFGIIIGRKQQDAQQTTCSFCVRTPSTHTHIIRNQPSLGIWIPGKQSPIFTFLGEIMQLLNTPVLRVCHWLHMSEIFNCLKEKLMCQWSPITESSEVKYWLSGMKTKEEDFASPPSTHVGFLQVPHFPPTAQNH